MENTNLSFKEFEIEIMESVDKAYKELDLTLVNDYIVGNTEVYNENVGESIGKFFQSILDAIKSLVKKNSTDEEEFDTSKLTKAQKAQIKGKFVKAFDYKKFISFVQRYSDEVVAAIEKAKKSVGKAISTVMAKKDLHGSKTKFKSEFYIETFIAKIPADKMLNDKNFKKPSKEILNEVSKISDSTVNKLKDIAKSVNNDSFNKFVMKETTKYSKFIAKCIRTVKRRPTVTAIFKALNIGMGVGGVVSMAADLRKIKKISDSTVHSLRKEDIDREMEAIRNRPVKDKSGELDERDYQEYL